MEKNQDAHAPAEMARRASNTGVVKANRGEHQPFLAARAMRVVMAYFITRKLFPVKSSAPANTTRMSLKLKADPPIKRVGPKVNPES